MNNEVNDGLYRLLWEVEIRKKDKWIPMKYSDPYVNEVVSSIIEWVQEDYSELQGSVPSFKVIWAGTATNHVRMKILSSKWGDHDFWFIKIW